MHYSDNLNPYERILIEKTECPKGNFSENRLYIPIHFTSIIVDEHFPNNNVYYDKHIIPNCVNHDKHIFALQNKKNNSFVNNFG